MNPNLGSSAPVLVLSIDEINDPGLRAERIEREFKDTGLLSSPDAIRDFGDALVRRQNGEALDPIALAHIEKIEVLLQSFSAKSVATQRRALEAQSLEDLMASYEEVKGSTRTVLDALGAQMTKITQVHSGMSSLVSERSRLLNDIEKLLERRRYYEAERQQLDERLCAAMVECAHPHEMSRVMDICRAGADAPYIITAIDRKISELKETVLCLEASIRKYAEENKTEKLLPEDMRPKVEAAPVQTAPAAAPIDPPQNRAPVKYKL